MSVTRTANRARAAIEREIRSLTVQHDAACSYLRHLENARVLNWRKIGRQRTRVSQLSRMLQIATFKRGP